MERTKTLARFKVGNTVRTKSGVTDPDFDDVPIGGWVGTVSDAEHGNPATYLIKWNQHTLANIHPVYRKRCERDGLDYEEMWLSEDDLEPDTGTPTKIEQPTKIATRPLSPRDQDDRIRMVFGLTADDPLPDVDEYALQIYYSYLSQNVTFPFRAEHGAEYGHPTPVKVIGLGDPQEEPMIDDMHGILCEARLEGQVVTIPLGEIDDAKPNRRLLADYNYWFANWQ
jgi:hypothetical protein